MEDSQENVVNHNNPFPTATSTHLQTMCSEQADWNFHTLSFIQSPGPSAVSAAAPPSHIFVSVEIRPNLLTLSRLSSLSALLRNRTALIIGSHEGARSTLFTNGNTAIPQPPMDERVDSCARVRKVPRGVFADRLLNLAVNQIKKQKAINGPSAHISEPSVEAQGKATYSAPIPEGNITLS